MKEEKERKFKEENAARYERDKNVIEIQKDSKNRPKQNSVPQ